MLGLRADTSEMIRPPSTPALPAGRIVFRLPAALRTERRGIPCSRLFAHHEPVHILFLSL